MKRSARTAAAILAAWLATPDGTLQAAQDLDQVREAALAHARGLLAGQPGEVKVEAPALDARLQLPGCAQLEAFLPGGTRLWGRAVVGVRCLRPEPWSVLVPVTVRVMGEAVFAARPLARGRPLEATDLDIQRVDLASLPAGVLSDPALALGRVPGVSVQAGLPLRAEMLRGATAVSTGQDVRILFVGDGFTVSSQGRSLGSGSVGDTLQVRSASGRVVRGVITGPGVVEVR